MKKGMTKGNPFFEDFLLFQKGEGRAWFLKDSWGFPRKEREFPFWGSQKKREGGKGTQSLAATAVRAAATAADTAMLPLTSRCRTAATAAAFALLPPRCRRRAVRCLQATADAALDSELMSSLYEAPPSFAGES